MPNLVRFLLLHAAIGFGLAAIFVAALLLADPGGIGTLLRRAPVASGPVLLLWLFTGMTFAAAQFGVAIMLLEQRQAVPARQHAVVRRRLG